VSVKASRSRNDRSASRSARGTHLEREGTSRERAIVMARHRAAPR